MIFKIEGGFSKGLKILNNDKVVIYSLKNTTWFSGNIIDIYNNTGELIVKVKEHGFFSSSFKVLINNINSAKTFTINSSFFSRRIKLNINKKTFVIAHRSIPIFSKNYAKLYFDKHEIGILKIKKISFNKSYELTLYKDLEDLNIFLLILILISETSYDLDL